MDWPDYLSETDEISFVPMAAVDDVKGAIVNPELRPIGEVWKGYKRFAEGDVIFARITPCMENGKTAIAKNLHNEIGTGSTEFIVMRPSQVVIADWLYHFVRQSIFRDNAAHAMTGTVGQLRVPPNYIAERPLPPSSSSAASSRLSRRSSPASTPAWPGWSRREPSCAATAPPCSKPPARVNSSPRTPATNSPPTCWPASSPSGATSGRAPASTKNPPHQPPPLWGGPRGGHPCRNCRPVGCGRVWNSVSLCREGGFLCVHETIPDITVENTRLFKLAIYRVKAAVSHNIHKLLMKKGWK